MTLKEGVLSDHNSAQDRVENAVEKLGTKAAGGKSDALQRYLRFIGRFHNYTFRTCIFIATHRNNVTLVAEYRRWQELDRQAMKVERGIAIFAPITRKLVKLESVRMGESDMRRLIRFRLARVFDVMQTDGTALPEFSRTTGDANQLIPAIERMTAVNGRPKRYQPWALQKIPIWLRG